MKTCCFIVKGDAEVLHWYKRGFFGAVTAYACSDFVLVTLHEVPNTSNWMRNIFIMSFKHKFPA